MCARVAKAGRCAGLKILWKVTFHVGSTPAPGTLETRSPTRGQGMLKAFSRSCSGMDGGRWVRSGFLSSRKF